MNPRTPAGLPSISQLKSTSSIVTSCWLTSTARHLAGMLNCTENGQVWPFPIIPAAAAGDGSARTPDGEDAIALGGPLSSPPHPASAATVPTATTARPKTLSTV
jgi:hypothetical protein